MNNLRFDFEKVVELIEQGSSKEVIETKLKELKEKYSDILNDYKFKISTRNIFAYIRKDGNFSEKVKYQKTLDELLETLSIYKSSLSDKEKYAYLKTRTNVFKNIEPYVIADYTNDLVKDLVGVVSFVKSYELKQLNKPKKMTKYEQRNKLVLSNLNTCLKTCKSNTSDMTRLYQLYNVYSKSSNMIDKIKKLNVEATGSELYREYMDMYCFFKINEENGTVKKIVEVVNNRKMYEELRVHMLVLDSYINSNDCNISNFLESHNINENQFERALFVTSKVNYEFYTKCIAKLKVDQINRQYSYREQLVEQLDAVEAGFDKEGNEYDVLDFFKNIPFNTTREFKLHSIPDKGLYIDTKAEHDIYFLQTLRKFINENIPDRVYIIDKIIRGFNSKLNKSAINYKSLYDSETVLNGVVITKEIKQKIFKYIKDNNLPNINYMYYKLRDIELKEGLDNYIDRKSNKEVKTYKIK